MKPLLSITAFICLTVTSPSISDAAAQSPVHAAKIYGNSNHGATLFKKWCVSCHGLEIRVTDQVPTLHQLATDPARTDNAIRAFLMQPHKPMPPLDLSTQEIEDIIAYLHESQPGPGVPANKTSP